MTPQDNAPQKPLTAAERAEKIKLATDTCMAPAVDCMCIKWIAAQIEEAVLTAEREAFIRGQRELEENSYDNGFNAAKEKAIGIVNRFNDSDDMIEHLGKMESGVTTDGGRE